MSDSPSSDPLEALHKMSRTAGLGAREYVAVNTAAVVALILGVASALVIMSTVLMAVPVATVVVAAIAIWQIRRSAGTQTGMGLAIMGLVIALGFVATVGGMTLVHEQRIRAEQTAITDLIQQFGANVSAHNYEPAWTQFDSRFKQRVSHDVFVNQLTSLQANPHYGQIKAVHSNGILDVEIDPDTGVMTATGFIVIDLASGQQDRHSANFRKDPDSGWMFEDISEYFPQPDKPAPN